MVTRPKRGERAMVWVLCRLLPEGFRPRQRGEWTGDLIAMSAGSATARWRYLLAAAWTLPALRAHARRAGLDRPPAMVTLSVPAATVAWAILIGLGVPVLSWLIAVPLRYVLLDVPGRLAASQAGHPIPFDPKDLWPVDGPLVILSPLWGGLTLGAYSIILGWLLLTWMGLTTAVLGIAKRGASRRHRKIAIMCAPALVMLGFVGEVMRATMFNFSTDKGLTTAVVGGAAVVFGARTRGLTRRLRLAVFIIGVAAVAIFAWHHTPVGTQMFIWYLD